MKNRLIGLNEKELMQHRLGQKCFDILFMVVFTIYTILIALEKKSR